MKEFNPNLIIFPYCLGDEWELDLNYNLLDTRLRFIPSTNISASNKETWPPGKKGD